MVRVGDFNTPLTSVGISSTQKMYKEKATLNDTKDQTDLNDIYRAFCPKSTEYIFFSSACVFAGIDHILGHKPCLKFKKTEIISSISDHNCMKL